MIYEGRCSSHFDLNPELYIFWLDYTSKLKGGVLCNVNNLRNLGFV